MEQLPERMGGTGRAAVATRFLGGVPVGAMPVRTALPELEQVSPPTDPNPVLILLLAHPWPSTSLL